jgi:hypothetical protein
MAALLQVPHPSLPCIASTTAVLLARPSHNNTLKWFFIFHVWFADPLPTEEMYFEDSSGRLRSRRSESQAESVQGRYNDIFSGSNVSTELAQALTEDFAGRSLVSAAVKTYGLKDHMVNTDSCVRGVV